MGIVRYRKWFFAFSGLLMLAAIVALSIQPSLKPGIDFTGGSALNVAYGSRVEVSIEGSPTLEQVRAEIEAAGLTDVIAAGVSDEPSRFSVFFPRAVLRPDAVDGEGNVTAPGDVATLTEALATLGAVSGVSVAASGADVSAAQVRDRLAALGYINAIVQAEPNNTFFIRVRELHREVRDGDVIVQPGDRQVIEEGLNEIAPARVTGFDSISGVIGAENVRNAIIAVVVASFVILFYVAWSFRRVPNPFRYGTTAIVALIHDVLVVLGTFAVLGKLVDLEVDAMFITGILTVIGYSVNDTIVVFDRLRENVAKYTASTLDEVMDVSIRETMGRSINTGLTTLIVVVALMLFGGPTIFQLLLVLLVGIVTGTYSSIFIASLLLASWEKGELGGFFRRLRLAPARR